MQSYSYIFVPLYPYPQAYTQQAQAPTMALGLNYALPPMITPFFHQPSTPATEDPPLPLPQEHQQDSNQAAPIANASISMTRNPSLQVSRTSREQSFVSDHNVYKYPKKNAESNLINQIFSYISIPSKSKKALLRLTHNDEEKVQHFYEIMRTLKRQNKKYINRNYLKELLMMEKSHIIHGILQKIKIESNISKKHLQHILRTLTTNFLREKCILTILTSSKLDRYAIKEHLARRRDVLHHLLYHMRLGGTGETGGAGGAREAEGTAQ